MIKKKTKVTSNLKLRELVIQRIKFFGPKCDLNDLDVSGIRSFYRVFRMIDFTGDISKWDVSKATDMYEMFAYSSFNGDISSWNVSNVKIMEAMFTSSDFNGDLSNWKPCNVNNMDRMFLASKFKNDSIRYWSVDNLENCSFMFAYSDYPYKDILKTWKNTESIKYSDNMFK